MCGINGIMDFNGDKPDRMILVDMNMSIEHRGPDAGNVEIFGNIGLGHRRLSIIDLARHADQPMISDEGQYAIAYNGEIYNFPALKDDLLALGFIFKTSSDTEVVLKAYEAWGTSCFQKFNGMFALAIVDGNTGELIIARDSLGIKPLYLHQTSGFTVFSSEIKAILKHPKVNRAINNQSITEYMWYGNTLGNNTFYKDISEVLPGQFLRFSKSGCFTHTAFFEAELVQEQEIDEADAVVKTRELLAESVERHMISDVPVGIFLSGGVDSSAITAFASKQGKRKVNTYTAAFDFQGGSNDLASAKSMSQLFNTKHQELSISGNDIADVIEALVHSHDQPFGDAANIPLYMMTRAVGSEMKVILQGDGGDELFGGYSIYKTIYNANKWNKLSFLSGLLDVVDLKNTRGLQIRRFLSAVGMSDRTLKTALLLTMESFRSDPLQIFNPGFRESLEKINVFNEFEDLAYKLPTDCDDLKSIFLTDIKITLPKTFLEKVDKSTMANSVEIRVPLLDKELTEFALSLPSDLKLKNGEQKYILRQALRGVIPDYVLDRPKTGFGVPYAYWLAKELRPFFTDHISTKAVSQVLNVNGIISMLDLHEKGKGNYGFLLWKTLNLAIWINQSSPSFASNN